MNNRLGNLSLIGIFFLVTACDLFDDGDDSSSSIGNMSSSGSSSSMGMPTAESYTSVRGGDFSRTAAGEELYADLRGHANLSVAENESAVEVHVWGLSPDTEYPAHVHNDVCANGGGGHYLHDPEGEDVAANGLWPLLTADGEGRAIRYVMQPFAVTEGAKSVVIHEPGSGDRIACANLVSSDTRMGTLNATTVGDELYAELQGNVYLTVRTDGTSKAEVSVMGLTEDGVYPAHVHLEDCASGGGAHYLQDPTGEDVADNGLWPIVNVNNFGYGVGKASNLFMVRFDEANSVVIHQPESGDRIACADLTMTRLAFRSGSFTVTDDGLALYGENGIQGQAKLEVTPEGESMVTVYASGLNADQTYPAHVHNGSCESGGGAHYLQSVIGEDIADNGLWPSVMTNSIGVGMGQATHDFIVRNDARSVVIHEPEGGARIACADLK